MNWVRDEQGSSIVEFAMGSILLLTILIGIMAMCFAYYSYNVVSEAARETARYAIVRGSACNSFADCKVTSAQLQTYAQNLGFPGIYPSNLTAATTWAVYPAGGTCQPSASCNNPGNQVTVTVTYYFPLNLPFLSRHTLKMVNTAAMVISQ